MNTDLPFTIPLFEKFVTTYKKCLWIEICLSPQKILKRKPGYTDGLYKGQFRIVYEVTIGVSVLYCRNSVQSHP